MIVCIEGNIGAGKTTAIKRLADLVAAYEEPVDRWTLLGKMYKDPAKFSFMFQMQVLISYVDTVDKALKETRPVVMERSPWSAANVFAKLCDWPPHMRKCYQEAYDTFEFEPDLVVYLDVPPEECLRRIRKRGRHSEEGISLEYLERVATLHEKAMAPGTVRVRDVDELVEVVKKFLFNKC